MNSASTTQDGIHARLGDVSPKAVQAYATLTQFLGRMPVSARTLAAQARVAVGTSVENQRRKVRELIKELRDAGHRVCENNDGYWLATSDGDWKKYLDARRCNARHEFVRTRRIQEAATDKASGQGKLFGDAGSTTEWSSR